MAMTKKIYSCTSKKHLFSSLILLIVASMNHVSGEKEILLDTRTALSDLGWTMSAGSEWQEMTSNDPSGTERRMLMVCGIQKSNQNNWMRSQYINVDKAQRVYVEMQFTIRSCEDVPNVATCKETFNLYYYETDRDEATSTFPPWEEASYTKVDTIAADQRFQPGSSNINFETRDVGPITKSGIYLAIQDTGACVALMYVRVYYKYCDRNTVNLATFAKTTTGPDVTSLVEAKGSCVRNAVTERNDLRPSLYCNGEGQWTVPSGTCICTAGYEPNKLRTQCLACQRSSYKSIVANRACMRCPDYSSSSVKGATLCDCMTGYYRAHTDSANHQCTKPPTKPVSLRTHVNKTSVTFTWSPPLNTGGRDDLSYEFHCLRCETKFDGCKACDRRTQYSTTPRGFTATRMVVSSLTSYAYYKFKVCALNGVTDIAHSSGEPLNNCVESSVETDQSAPSSVAGFRAMRVRDGVFLLSWEAPIDTNGKILDYQVRVDHMTEEPTSGKATDVGIHLLNSTTERRMLVKGVKSGETYLAKVRARTVAGYGPFNAPIRVKAAFFNNDLQQSNDGNVMEVDSSSMDTLQLFLIIGGCVLITAGLALFVIFCRRRQAKRLNQKKRDPEKSGVMYNGKSVHFTRSLIAGHTTYIDPTTYEDPHRAVREFTKEIDSTLVKIEEVIGGGEFGEVCKGKLQLGSKSPQEVAIKTLKSGYSTQQKLDFLGEASIMGQFDHPNVIRLEGVVTKSRPLMIITEYMKNGSLDSFLRCHDNQLNVVELVRILRDIASGMKYLSEMGYIHRDLAARNILVNSDLVCKVSDFGMSRVLEEDEDAAYTTRGGKIPIRWTAPEAITFRKFTSASDVWSYGIVMWEVMSYGERPYWGMSNRDVMNAIENGYRLPAPMDCPQLLHELMLDCWKQDRSHRPKFNQIVTSLDKMLNEPEQLRIKVSNRRNPSVPTSNIIPARPSSVVPLGSVKLSLPDTRLSSTPLPNGTSASFMNDNTHEDSPMLGSSNDDGGRTNEEENCRTDSLETWLGSLGLSKYINNFVEHGRTKKEQICNITSSELARMGIVDSSHQEALMSTSRNVPRTTGDRDRGPPSYVESNLSYSGISV